MLRGVITRIPRMPFGLELLVEGPQRLDLHRVAHPLEEPLLDAVHESIAGLTCEHRPKRREVEREAGIATLAEIFDRVDDNQFGQSVGMFVALGSSHEVE